MDSHLSFALISWCAFQPNFLEVQKATKEATEITFAITNKVINNSDNTGTCFYAIAPTIIV